MMRSLRKGEGPLHVAYKGGGFTNNLSGDNFTLEVDGDKLILGIDLSRNIRTRNKRTNSYIDAVEFSEQHEELAFIQLHDKQVIDGLAWGWKRAQNPRLVLSLRVGEHGPFSYEVDPTPLPGDGLELTVRPQGTERHA